MKWLNFIYVYNILYLYNVVRPWLTKDSSVRSSSYCFQFPFEAGGLEKPATIFLPNLVRTKLLTTLRGASFLPFSNQMVLLRAPLCIIIIIICPSHYICPTVVDSSYYSKILSSRKLNTKGFIYEKKIVIFLCLRIVTRIFTYFKYAEGVWISNYFFRALRIWW